MRRLFLIVISIGILLGTGAAVVGGSNASEDGVAITTTDSSATGVATENSTWQSELNNLNSSCLSGVDTGVNFTDTMKNDNKTTVSFSGILSTSTPCVSLESDVEEIAEDSYRITVQDRTSDDSANEVCIECVGQQEIEGSFTADGDYKVEIVRNDEVLAEKDTREPETQTTEEKSFWSRILAFFRL